MAKKKRKMTLYKKSLIVFTLILLILGEIFLIYVSRSLKEYELGDVNNFLDSVITSMANNAKIGNIEKYFALSNVSSEYEKNSSLVNGYKQLFANSEITYKKIETNIYEVYADDILICKITLNGDEEIRRLGLLKFTSWKVDTIESYNENGLFTYNLYVPDSYSIKINNVDINKNDLVKKEKIEELTDAYSKVTLPYLNHYEVSGLTYIPEIKVYDKNNKEVSYELKNYELTVNDYKNIENFDDAKEYIKDDFNPLTVARNWSKFLTDDLSGTRHGYSTISKNLIEGTSMATKAYKWATQIDITFTSVHTLDSFTNEKVENCIIYSENAFSCEVYLEKNMTIGRTNTQKTDILHDRMYFVYYDNAYRLIYMKAITN